MNMQTTPLKLILVIVFLLGCLGVLGYSLKSSGLVDGLFVPKTPMASESEIVAHMPADRRDAAKKVMAQALREYDRLHERNAPGYKEGREAVRLFAGFAVGGDEHGEGVVQRAAGAARMAKVEGLRDPLVQAAADYLEYFNGRSQSPTDLQGHVERVEALAGASYPVACLLRPIGAGLDDLRRYDVGKRPEMAGFVDEKREVLTGLGLDVIRALGGSGMPDGYVAQEAEWFADRFRYSKGRLDAVAPRVDAALVEAGAGEADLALFRADLLLTQARLWRGSGGSETVTPEMWAEMKRSQAEAQAVLEGAAAQYPGDARLAAKMIEVLLARGQKRPKLDEWYQRAVAADPKCYDAYNNRMSCLQPWRAGTEQEVLDFGRECVDTGYWETNVPLVMVNGLGMLAANRKEVLGSEMVWKPLSATLRKYLSKYPASVRTRTQYLALAVRAEKWREAAEQSAILGENWDQMSLPEGRYRRLQAEAEAHKDGR